MDRICGHKEEQWTTQLREFNKFMQGEIASHQLHFQWENRASIPQGIWSSMAKP